MLWRRKSPGADRGPTHAAPPAAISLDTDTSCDTVSVVSDTTGKEAIGQMRLLLGERGGSGRSELTLPTDPSDRVNERRRGAAVVARLGATARPPAARLLASAGQQRMVRRRLLTNRSLPISWYHQYRWGPIQAGSLLALLHISKDIALAKNVADRPADDIDGRSDGLDRLRADVAADPRSQAAYDDAVRRAALSEELQLARTVAGLMQGEVAAAMGTTQSAVSELERGRGGEPKLQTVQRYARAVKRRLDFAVVDPVWPVYDQRMAKLVWRTIEHLTLSPLLTAIATGRRRDRTLPELAQIIDVDEAVVRYVIDSLLERGWVISERDHDTDVFSLGERAAYVVGLSLERERVIGVLMNLHAKVMFRRDVELPDTSYQIVLDAAVDVVRQLYALRGQHDVVGVGVSVAGVVASDTGTIRFAPDLAGDGDPRRWSSVPFEGDLQATLQEDLNDDGLLVIVENDANALAMDQYLRHAARAGDRNNRDSCVTVILLSGAGVGAGFVYGGHIIHGANSAAGEGGHAIIEPDGSECRSRLGHRGCLETVASARGIVQLFGLTSESKGEIHDSLQDLAERARRDDESVHEAFRTAGVALGRFIGGVITINDPGRIAIYADDLLVRSSYVTAQEFQRGVSLGIDEYTAKDDGVERPTDLSWTAIEPTSYAAAAGSTVIRQFLYRPEHWAPSIVSASHREQEGTPANEAPLALR